MRQGFVIAHDAKCRERAEPDHDRPDLNGREQPVD
jgi:hypothetical protein